MDISKVSIQPAGGLLGSSPARWMEKYNSQKRAIFITVSPNPEKRHPVDRTVWLNERTPQKVKHLKIRYDAMTHKEQYKYLKEYIAAVYGHRLEASDSMYWVYELNSSNLLHAHILLTGSNYKTDYDLMQLRQDVLSHYLTQYNLPKGRKDYMNNIVWATDPKDTMMNYMTKQSQTGIKQHFPDEWINL